jgi:hypothetical protein
MRSHHWLSAVTVGALLALVPVATWAEGARDSGPPRYQARINSEDALLQTLAAGLVADALGYDANEVLNSVAKTNMPLEDIVPVYMVSYLSDRSYVAVVDKRTDGDKWGAILDEFRVSPEDLQALQIPRDVEVTDLRTVPDGVLEDLLVCAAVSEVFDVDPDEVYGYYQDGWSATDVLAAANLAYRSRETMATLLSGKAVRVDWYREAGQLGIDLSRVARDNGRCFDNTTPVLSKEPGRGDLGTTYAADAAVRIYEAPLADVQELRYRYLLSPSEVLSVLYVARTCGRPYWEVARVYGWDHWHAWAPSLVVLRVPMSHFASVGVWRELPLDFYAIDPWELDRVLLGLSLSLGGAFTFDFYHSTFYPWYDPWDPILYCGLHWRHGWGWDDYHSWRREGRPWRDHPTIGKDWGDWRSSRDWAGGRVVGVVVGDQDREHQRRAWDRPPRNWDRAYGPTAPGGEIRKDGQVEYGQYPGMVLHKGGRGERPGQGGQRVEYGERPQGGTISRPPSPDGPGDKPAGGHQQERNQWYQTHRGGGAPVYRPGGSQPGGGQTGHGKVSPGPTGPGGGGPQSWPRDREWGDGVGRNGRDGGGQGAPGPGPQPGPPSGGGGGSVHVGGGSGGGNVHSGGGSGGGNRDGGGGNVHGGGGSGGGGGQGSGNVSGGGGGNRDGGGGGGGRVQKRGEVSGRH